MVLLLWLVLPGLDGPVAVVGAAGFGWSCCCGWCCCGFGGASCVMKTARLWPVGSDKSG